MLVRRTIPGYPFVDAIGPEAQALVTDDYLTKPIDRQRLATRLRQLRPPSEA